MPVTRKIGDISLKVGEYHDPATNRQRNRSRNTGSLMLTEHSTGEARYWIKLNIDCLSPSLAALAMRYVAEGDDSVALSVFAAREESSTPSRRERPAPPPAGPPAHPAMHNDDIPF